MAGYPNAQYRAVQVHAHQQVDVTGIAIGGHCRKDQAHRAAILPGYPCMYRPGFRGSLVSWQGNRAVQQVVVVAALRNNLEQGFCLGPGGLLGNPVFGEALGQRNGAAGQYGKQTKADSTATDGGSQCAHGQPPFLPGRPRRGLWWP